MADYGKMSDAELMALVQPKPAAVPSTATDYSKLSDADLLKMVAPKQTEAPSVAADVAKSAGVGLVKGGLGIAGLVGDLTDLGAKGLEKANDFVTDHLGMERYRPAAPDARATSVLNYIPTAASLQKNVEGVTGEFYKPKTTAGEYAQTAGEFVPALVGGPETLASKLVSRVAVPAAVSETAGQVTKGTAAEPYARVAGALLSPLATTAARRAVTPLPASVERTALADNLAHEGVDLTAGQRTGSRPLQWAESTFGDMPGSGGNAARIQERQAEQFTAAGLRRAGETADRATPQVIDNAFNRIGGQFDSLAQRNTLAADHQMGRDLIAAENDYHALVGPNNRAPIVADTIDDIRHFVAQNGGHLTGEQYNSLTSRIARQARAAKNDPPLQESLQNIRGALDDGMERSLQASGNTAGLAAWREARTQYRNLLVLEKAATGAGSATAEGLISPSQLRNATVGQNRRAYARGQGDFADLARSGEALMKPLPQSGTAPRQNMQHVLTMLGGAAGGAAGGFPGAAAGIVAPAIAGRILMSRPVQAYLGNQVLGPAVGNRLVQGTRSAMRAQHQNNEAGGNLSVDAVVSAMLAANQNHEPARISAHPEIVRALQGR